MSRVLLLALVMSSGAVGVVSWLAVDPQVNLQAVTPGVQQVGHVNVSGKVLAGSVSATDAGASAQVITGTASSATGSTYGGLFRVSSGNGTGVRGVAQSATGAGVGGSFQSSSPNGAGVQGFATAASGTNYGVYGQASSPNGFAGYFVGRLGTTGGGVFTSTGIGLTVSTTGPQDGIQTSTSAEGRSAINASHSGTNSGFGGFFVTENGRAVQAEDRGSIPGTGLYAKSSNGTGVEGVSNAASGTTNGVVGQSSSPSGRGVYGRTTGSTSSALRGDAAATAGVNFGVWGRSFSPQGYGGYFVGPGVGLEAWSLNGLGDGIRGIASGGNGKAGVYGSNTGTSNAYGGVFQSSGGAGALGIGTGTNQVGVLGRGIGVNAVGLRGEGYYAVYGASTSGTAFGGYFDGYGYFAKNVGIGTSNAADLLDLTGGANNTSLRFAPGRWYGVDTAGKATIDIPGTGDLLFWDNVHVNNTLTAGAKNFEIDHPLDPSNKVLRHGCVESDEYRNIYDGTVTTDAKGYATVAMPAWFESLNERFRYQLTVLDEGDAEAFVQAKVVRKLAGNRFTIRTSAPSVEVSWQITGVRKDAYAKANPLVVEDEKHEAVKGKLLHPVPRAKQEPAERKRT